MPRGGKRPGAGRKPASEHLRLLKGGRSRRPQEPAAPVVPAPIVDPAAAAPAADILTPPAYLVDLAEIGMWNELAPLALEQRTLTKATVRSLTVLCRVVLLEQKLALLAAGGAEHRGTLQRMNALMLQFNLTPCGKALFEPVAEVEQPKTGLSRFRSAK